MSNLHVNLDEANKHDPKGFIPAPNNTILVKSETGSSLYEERMLMPKAINFVDGTLPPPTTADYDAYVLIGGPGVIDGGWGNAAFGDMVRFVSSIPAQMTPLQGYLCYDDTAAAWMEYDGAAWNVFGGGGATNLGIANITATNLDVTSDTGTDATVPTATGSDAGLMSAAKFNEVVANNAKVTNATHTGEVTGSGALTVDKNVISNKSLVTANGADHVLIGDASDADNLKKVLVSDFLGGGLPSLTDQNLWIGNGSNVPTERTMNGDATMNNIGTITVADDAINYDKIQNVTDERLLGNFSGGVGSVQEIAISNDLQVLLGVLGLNTTPLYISDITTVNLLDDVANWTSGNYTGTAITGTFQGQHHVNSSYWFTCTHDNVWIRMARI